MKTNTENCVATCRMWNCNKVMTHKRYGMQSVLQIPGGSWTNKVMDILILPSMSCGFTQISVIVNMYIKMAHFVPLSTNTDTALLIEVFLRKIWQPYCLTTSIVLNCDCTFTFSNWQEVANRLEIRSRMSTTIHCQTGGQISESRK